MLTVSTQLIIAGQPLGKKAAGVAGNRQRRKRVWMAVGGSLQLGRRE